MQSQIQFLLKFQIKDEESVLITGVYLTTVEKIIKENNGKKCNNYCWEVPKTSYKKLMIALQQSPEFQLPLQPLPIFLENFHQSQIAKPKLSSKSSSHTNCCPYNSHIGGRILLADEIIIGQEERALTLVSYYQYAILIICVPKSTKIWFEKICENQKLSANEIQIIKKKTLLPFDTSKLVTIIEIQCCQQYEADLILKNFDTCIADFRIGEQNIFLSSIFKKIKHIIILQILSNLLTQQSLFHSLNLLRPDIFPELKTFILRYFEERYQPCFEEISFTSFPFNQVELSYLLSKIMIRKMRAENDQLPEKRRRKINIKCNLAFQEQSEFQILKNKIKLSQTNSKQISIQWQKDPNIFRRLEDLCTSGKKDPQMDWIKRLLQQKTKFLYFANQKTILNQVEEYCKSSGIDSIRIDGDSGKKARRLAQEFQDKENVLVAIISLGLKSLDIDLTASSIIVFGEIPITYAYMLQAESLVYRVGQKKLVTCYYLVGDQTIDENICDGLEIAFKTIQNTFDLNEGNQGDLPQFFYQDINSTQQNQQQIVDNMATKSKKEQQQNKRLDKVDNLIMSAVNQQTVYDGNIDMTQSQLERQKSFTSSDYNQMFQALEEEKIRNIVKEMQVEIQSLSDKCNKIQSIMKNDDQTGQ